MRVRAPRLAGRGWVGAERLDLPDLRGRVVVLHFWTAGCVNCLHVLDELRPLEAAHPDVVVVLGVHSPKFPHEADPAAVRDAVSRHGVAHPVLDDADRATWGAYAVSAWPTLVVVDPRGYVAATYVGEGHAAELAGTVERLLDEQRAHLRPGPPPGVAPPGDPGGLRFPAGLLRLPDGGLLVADTGHHALVRPDGTRVAGDGTRGPGPHRLAEPRGLLLLPPGVAARAGYDVVVADTGNHALRGLRLADGSLRTLLVVPRSSPWDVAWHEGRVVVAAAGLHRLLAYDPLGGTVADLAGTGREGLVDGALADAWFAQPSGLAVVGGDLWVADAESSALRRVRGGRVATAVGQGLFAHGHRDGPGEEALLQHPQGLVALPDGAVGVLDTYDGAVRRYDPASGRVTTLATGLAEPVAAVVDGGALLVVESAAHALRRVPLGPGTQVGVRQEQRRAPQPVAPAARLEVRFAPPEGEALDERYGPATRLAVAAAPAALLRGGAGRAPGLVRDLELDPAVGEGVLLVSASAASCGAGEDAVCRVHQGEWELPVRVDPSGGPRIVTDLRP
ncbi:redoxin family protein [Vallicoccus soli]|uniref:Alkyl hydroperoxide reductase n=1 Tax=Vallicoccus soli TaxID=2339232 RepID=A0A3A3YYN9_9ACTN|nr:thioredoxin-like domain-containing protein [Vallicoccus soli]RJK94248.1 alkyl hydroperoxide reductase [Vallicoccus soli]